MLSSPVFIINTAEVTIASDPDTGDNGAEAVIAVAGLIFTDGFESGDTTTWSKVVGAN